MFLVENYQEPLVNKKTDAGRILKNWKCPTGEKQEKEMPFTHSTWLWWAVGVTTSLSEWESNPCHQLLTNQDQKKQQQNFTTNNTYLEKTHVNKEYYFLKRQLKIFFSQEKNKITRMFLLQNLKYFHTWFSLECIKRE